MVFASQPTTFLSENGWKKFFIFPCILVTSSCSFHVQYMIQNVPQREVCPQHLCRSLMVAYTLFKGSLSVLFFFLIVTSHIHFTSFTTAPFPGDIMFLIQGHLQNCFNKILIKNRNSWSYFCAFLFSQIVLPFHIQLLQQITQDHGLTNTHDKRNAIILEINSVCFMVYCT